MPFTELIYPHECLYRISRANLESKKMIKRCCRKWGTKGFYAHGFHRKDFPFPLCNRHAKEMEKWYDNNKYRFKPWQIEKEFL